MTTQHFTKYGLYTLGLGLTLVIAAAVAALAGTAFTDFNVNANVPGACTITATTLAFGDYAPPVHGEPGQRLIPERDVHEWDRRQHRSEPG